MVRSRLSGLGDIDQEEEAAVKEEEQEERRDDEQQPANCRQNDDDIDVALGIGPRPTHVVIDDVRMELLSPKASENSLTSATSGMASETSGSTSTSTVGKQRLDPRVVRRLREIVAFGITNAVEIRKILRYIYF